LKKRESERGCVTGTISGVRGRRDKEKWESICGDAPNFWSPSTKLIKPLSNDPIAS